MPDSKRLKLEPFALQMMQRPVLASQPQPSVIDQPSPSEEVLPELVLQEVLPHLDISLVH